MHFGVQSFHTAVEHFGKACNFGHFGHRQALFSQELGGAARRDEAHAQGVQVTREFDDAGFVRDRDKGSHGNTFFKLHFSKSCSSNFLRKVLRFRPNHSAARDWF